MRIPLNAQSLYDVLGDDARVIEVDPDGCRVVAQWEDGSIDSLRNKHGEWHFDDDNIAYQAGYAYACGYKD